MLLRKVFVLCGVFAMLVASATVSSLASAQELKLDEKESKITFVGSKPEGKHEGGFKKFKCVAKADFENPENGSMVIEIDTPSLYSDDEKLTNHLKAPDFFDVRKFPKIKFESLKVVPGEEGTAKLVGKMTMLEKTNEIEVPVVFTMVDSKLTLKADFKLDRTKWGMTYGAGKIDNDVKVVANLVFTVE